MKKLDKFILKAFLGPFIAILLIVVFILMMQFLWLYIDELVGKGLDLIVIAEFLFWGGCTILPLALPLSTLLASMMLVGQLGENNELMAIKAAGISLARVFVPLGVTAAAITVGAFFSGNNLVPKAYNEIYTLRDDIIHTKEEIKIPSGTFYDGIEGYIMRVNEQGDDGMMYDVMVYDHTGKDGNTTVTMADSSTIRVSGNKDYLTFTLFNGSNYKETNVKKYRDTTLDLQRIDFTRQELIIPLKNYSFAKSDSSRFGDQVKSMTVSQLAYQRDSLTRETGSMFDRHYSRMTQASFFLERSQLDTARAKNLTADFTDPNYLRWPTIQDKIAAYGKAQSAANRLSGEIYSMNSDVYAYNFYLNHTNIEFMKKFAQALACLLFFFIGAPLGAMIRKGGLGSSAIVSVLFFLLYWVIDISGTKLARDGQMNAFTGAFMSAYVLAPIGAFLTWKAINDASLFSADNIKNRARMIWSRIYRFFRPVRIVFMGTPEFAVASLDALLAAKYNVVGVVTVADKPSGRGLQVNESAVKKYAVAHNIPVLQPLRLKDPGFLSALRAWKADMFVVVAFRLLPEEVWKMPRLGTFNLHAALLPQYRGAAPINWAVINGEKMTGVTTFMIDKDMDTGGIIFRQECRIGPEDTAGDVHDRLMAIGAELVPQTVEALVQHNVETRVQRSFVQGNEVLKPAPKLTRELCDIDWNDSVNHIYNLIRGLSPYPAAFTTLFGNDGKGQQLKIYRAETLDLRGEPGQVLSDGRTYMAIAAADGAIGLKEIQIAGKKRMEVKAFLAGFRSPEQYRCRKTDAQIL